MKSKPVIDVYLTPRAVIRASMNGTLTARTSLFIFRQAREFVLSDDTEQLLEDLMANETEYGAALMAFAAIRTIDPPVPQKSRVAWIKKWGDKVGSRQGVSFLLSSWRLEPFSIKDWNSSYPLGFLEAVRMVLEAANPGRFRFFS